MHIKLWDRDTRGDAFQGNVESIPIQSVLFGAIDNFDAAGLPTFSTPTMPGANALYAEASRCLETGQTRPMFWHSNPPVALETTPLCSIDAAKRIEGLLTEKPTLPLAMEELALPVFATASVDARGTPFGSAKTVDHDELWLSLQAHETSPSFWQTNLIDLQTEPLCADRQPDALARQSDTPAEKATLPRQQAAPVASITRLGEGRRFRLVEKVHHGRMSVVWRAFDEARGRPVAVKLVPEHLAPAFDMEALAELVRISQHPGLATLIEHGWQDQCWYQVAEWLDGKTLAALCRSSPTSSAQGAELEIWMKQLAGALETHHRAGFVHGDVKPSNVIVTSGQAQLIDLVGLRIGASWVRHGGLTPEYASPEALGGDPADPRDDVYSLAATLVELLTGVQFAGKHAAKALTPPAGITAFQWRTLRSALDSTRTDRIESASALVEAIWPASSTPLSETVPTWPRWPSSRAAPARPRRAVRRWSRLHDRPAKRNAAIAAGLATLVVVGTLYPDWSGVPPAAGTRAAAHSAEHERVESAAGEHPAGDAFPAVERVDSTTLAAIEQTFESIPTGGSAGSPTGGSAGSIRTATTRASAPTQTTPAVSSAAVAFVGGMVGLPRPEVPVRNEVRRDDHAHRDVLVRPDTFALIDGAEASNLLERRRTSSTSNSADTRARLMPAVYRVMSGGPVAADARAATEQGGPSPGVEQLGAPARPERPEVAAPVQVALLDQTAPERHETLERNEQPQAAERPERLDTGRADRPERLDKPERLDRPDKPDQADRLEKPEQADRVERPPQPERVDRPNQPERAERLEQPERVERPEQPQRVERLEQPERVERPDQPERVERPDQPERVERPDQPERVERPEQPERIERPEQPERIERPEQPERIERPEQPERIERPEQPERIERPEQPERIERPEQPERIERPEQPERIERPERPDRHERPERPDKIERPDKPDRPDRPGG